MPKTCNCMISPVSYSQQNKKNFEGHIVSRGAPGLHWKGQNWILTVRVLKNVFTQRHRSSYCCSCDGPHRVAFLVNSPNPSYALSVFDLRLLDERQNENELIFQIASHCFGWIFCLLIQPQGELDRGMRCSHKGDVNFNFSFRVIQKNSLSYPSGVKPSAI